MAGAVKKIPSLSGVEIKEYTWDDCKSYKLSLATSKGKLPVFH